MIFTPKSGVSNDIIPELTRPRIFLTASFSHEVRMSLRTGSLLSISAISLLITSPVIADLVFSTSKSDFDKVLDIPSDVWDKAIIGMAVNATNDSEIKGKNMTLPYGPAAPDSVGWEYSIHVRDDIPAPNGLGFITGVELRTHGPYDEARPLPTNESILTVPMHPSWDICRLVWAGPNLRSDTPISGPGCKGFLPDDCIADLKQQLKDTGVCSFLSLVVAVVCINFEI
ncbi:hypothetical protein QBC35DRAFT_502339 [Podospora australis]|uniref:Uncharacterized protein n=1 Tax=Podospora australis TaxID=1536484 RepID=A0AAN6WTL5_9PEZI|nr:hypothetical protein QBC35DRAFT_502339 [Podospora australis]